MKVVLGFNTGEEEGTPDLAMEFGFHIIDKYVDVDDTFGVKSAWRGWWGPVTSLLEGVGIVGLYE